MNSKQEKLAAARKKLKEFQRDLDNSKQNIDESILKSKYANNSLNTTDYSSLQCILNTDGLKNIGYENENLSIIKLENDNKSFPCEGLNYSDKNNEEKINCESSRSTNNLKKSSLTHSSSSPLFDVLKKNNSGENQEFQSNMLYKEVCFTSLKQNILSNSSVNKINENVSASELKKSSKEDFSTIVTNNISNSMQLELHNYIQTINLLIQQKNEAQNSLNETQSLLNKKLEEINQQKQSISNLTFESNKLQRKLSDMSTEYMSLKLENERNIEKYNKVQSNFMLLQSQFDAKNEEFLELNIKYEEKKKEFEQLKKNLSESQGQLSLCLIQLQQLSNEDNSELTAKIFNLQSDNVNLNQQCENLKKKLEIINAERDQSEQKFRVYAQQCNSQFNTLNSQIECLRVENEKIKQDNDFLIQKLANIEDKKEGKFFTEDYQKEIEELHCQINILKKTIKNYEDNCHKKGEEIKILLNKIQKKENEIKNLNDLLSEADSEKQNLLMEMEIPKANKQLLAALESDKIAAAKAVSQNQKLKNQIIELEKAFVKLSEEKLILTDQLAHEKRINKEIQNGIGITNPCHSHQNNYLAHTFGDNLNDESEVLVNDSKEIEELQKIIKQLQNDKIELKARLNSFTTLKSPYDFHNSSKNSFNCKLKIDELESENSKLLLHQMEEKVRKTMNEIAVLDEEKEKLEHLVMQLQGETETIGEYITLYQRQRMLLKQRAQEKDNQLIQLSKDKEELKSKLVTLDELVQLLIKERESYSSQSDLANTTFKTTEKCSNTITGKIRALINEIGTTNLINSQSVGIEHCSCCSGRLITI